MNGDENEEEKSGSLDEPEIDEQEINDANFAEATRDDDDEGEEKINKKVLIATPSDLKNQTADVTQDDRERLAQLGVLDDSDVEFDDRLNYAENDVDMLSPIFSELDDDDDRLLSATEGQSLDGDTDDALHVGGRGGVRKKKKTRAGLNQKKIEGGFSSDGAVADSPGLEVLEQLFRAGTITGTEMAKLKSRYMLLWDLLEKTRNNEFTLLQHSKQWTSEVEHQNVELAKGDEFPENINTEYGRMREQLLKTQNSNMEIEERLEGLNYKVKSLESEKAMLLREYERGSKKENIENRIKDLNQEIGELRRDIEKQRIDAKKTKEALKESEEEMVELRSMASDKRAVLDANKAELLKLNAIPSQLMKELEKIRKNLNEVTEENEQMSNELDELNNAQNESENNLMMLEIDLAKNKKNSIRELDSVMQTQNALDQIKKKIEQKKQLEMDLLTDQATIEMNLKHLMIEKKSLYTTRNRKIREKDIALKETKQAICQKRNIEDSIKLLTVQRDEAESDYQLYPKSDPKTKKVIKKWVQEIENLKIYLENQQSDNSIALAKLDQIIQEEERYEFEKTDMKVEKTELKRLAQIKADEREHKARDYLRAEKRFHQSVEELRAKDLEIQDHKKKYHETQLKLRDFAQLYEVIKAERNKCVNLITISTQKLAELREKIRIENNEIEILQTSLQQKNDLLNRQNRRYRTQVAARDRLRSEQSQQTYLLSIQKESLDQLRLDINRLNQLCSRAEESLVQLRKRSDRAVQARNERAVQLIERNEEVCVLRERLQLLEEKLKEGRLQLAARDEDKLVLDRFRREESRTLGIVRNRLPNKARVEKRLVETQIQLSMAQDHVEQLEKCMESPEHANRLRLVGGDGQSGSEEGPLILQRQLERLQLRLDDKESFLLEKDLLLAAVSKLTDDVESKAGGSKAVTLELAKQINAYKADTKTVTKKLKAITAELTMQMAEAMRLKQQSEEKEVELEQCYKRMEEGLPPDEHLENLWNHELARQILLERSNKHAKMNKEMEERQFVLPNGGVSSVGPRPNAYMPESENELPIPRPYGAKAPFKPSEPGSNMRHIRKPIIKPIEI